MGTTVAIHKGKESWIRDIDYRLSGASYPMDRNVAENKLKGVNIDGDDATNYFSNIEWPVHSYDDFIRKFRLAKMHASGSEQKPIINIGGLTS
jgi:predicted transcriptional regulator